MAKNSFYDRSTPLPSRLKKHNDCLSKKYSYHKHCRFTHKCREVRNSKLARISADLYSSKTTKSWNVISSLKKEIYRGDKGRWKYIILGSNRMKKIDEAHYSSMIDKDDSAKYKLGDKFKFLGGDFRTCEIGIKRNSMHKQYYNERYYDLEDYLEFVGWSKEKYPDLQIMNYWVITPDNIMKDIDKYIVKKNFSDVFPLINEVGEPVEYSGGVLYKISEDTEFYFFNATTHYQDGYFIFKNKADYNAFRELLKKEIIRVKPPILEDALVERITKQVISPFKNEKLKQLADNYSFGLLITGDPGNGKTMLCSYLRYLCKENDIEYKQLTGKDITSSRENMSSLVNKNGVIFFDDVDIGLFKRKSSGTATIASDLLSGMDGLDKNTFCIRIFTTNEKIHEIDPAFLRPGRIDEIIQIEKPTIGAKRQIIKEHWPEEFSELFLTFPDLDDMIGDMSGAELNLVKNLAVQQITIHEMDQVDVGLCFEQYNNFRGGVGTIAKRKKIGLG